MIDGRTVFTLKELSNRAMMITAATVDSKIRWRDVEYVRPPIYPEVLAFCCIYLYP